MRKGFNAFITSLILAISILYVTGCSGDRESEASIEQETLTNEEQIIELDQKQEENASEDLIDEENIPTSEFTTYPLAIGSIILKSDLNIGSTIEKEVIKTLTEFNAVSTGDGAKLTLPENILFDFDSDELRSEADKVIDQLVQVIETTNDEVVIIGHTDNQGNEDYNQKLSERRAESVRQSLIESDIDEKRLKAKGKGASEPLAENTHNDGSDNPEGRQKNRRVEIIVRGLNK